MQKAVSLRAYVSGWIASGIILGQISSRMTIMPQEQDLRMTMIEPQDQQWGDEDQEADSPVAADRLRATLLVGAGDAEDEAEPSYDRPSTAAPRPGQRARPYRPSTRPPMAVLAALDDNQKSYELTRIRGDSCVIGRDDGDVTIPHEIHMSGRHAEIVRKEVEDTFRWYLRDLGSTNGTFVKADWIRLKEGDEFIVGSQHMRFSQRTDGDTANHSHGTSCELLEIVTRQHVPLEVGELWLGRTPDLCPPFMADDPLLDMKHARVFRDTDNRWRVANQKSLNGLWVRVDEVGLRHGCWFQLGEQRFRVFLR